MLTPEQMSTEIHALRETVALLTKAVGLDHLMSPRMSAEEIAANRPGFTFPSGDYNLAYRVRQIGISQDLIVKQWAESGAGAGTPGTGGGISESRIREIAREEIGSGEPGTGTGISESRVREIVSAMIAGIPTGGSGGASEARVREIVNGVVATLPAAPGAVSNPPSFQWPDESNGFVAPAGSGGPQGRPALPLFHRGNMLFAGNVAPEGTDATSGANGQIMGIAGRSKGRLRVNTRGGADGDGGMRDTTNYVELEERAGVGTITRRGYDIYCSVPDAVSIRTALWTVNPDGKRDGGIFILKRVSPTHFIGNWSDPALDYENRAFTISGADQPDRDRFSTKSGADSNGVYGWRIDKPRNSAEAHATYAEDKENGYGDGGDFLLRLVQDNGSQDIGKYSRFVTFNEGRGIAFATSNGAYSDVRDVLIIQPGRDGQPGRCDISVDGGVRVLESYDLGDGRRGVCFRP